MRALPLALLLSLPLPLIAQEAAPTATAPAITVASAVTAELSDRVYASGRIAPVEEVAVAPQIEGQRIETLLVDLGDWVERGQVMAELADETLILQCSQLQAS